MSSIISASEAREKTRRHADSVIDNFLRACQEEIEKTIRHGGYDCTVSLGMSEPTRVPEYIIDECVRQLIEKEYQVDVKPNGYSSLIISWAE